PFATRRYRSAFLVGILTRCIAIVCFSFRFPPERDSSTTIYCTVKPRQVATALHTEKPPKYRGYFRHFAAGVALAAGGASIRPLRCGAGAADSFQAGGILAHKGGVALVVVLEHMGKQYVQHCLLGGGRGKGGDLGVVGFHRRQKQQAVRPA